MNSSSTHIFLLALSLLLPGCAGYQVGSRTLYAPEIQTVYVPIFESDSFRRNLGEQLTEAVAKEIELKTPYKVVSAQGSDSVLSGRILDDTKRITIDSQSNQGREFEIGLKAEVRWIDRHGDLIRQEAVIPIDRSLILIEQTTIQVPEGGQSLVSQQQKAIQRLAEQIVATMEAPW